MIKDGPVVVDCGPWTVDNNFPQKKNPPAKGRRAFPFARI